MKSQFVISRFPDKTEWGGSRRQPYAFTELGVAMLSSVLRSPLAIQVNIGIMRAFVTIRQALTAMTSTANDVAQLRKDFENLKLDIEDILHDQRSAFGRLLPTGRKNDINESTRAQLDAISTALAELQPKDPKPTAR